MKNVEQIDTEHVGETRTSLRAHISSSLSSMAVLRIRIYEEKS